MQGNRLSAVLSDWQFIIWGDLVSGLDLKDILDEGSEGRFDINVFLGAYFHEAPALLASILLRRVMLDHLVRHVNLVAHEHHNDVLP